MDIIFCHAARSCYVVNFRGGITGLNSLEAKNPIIRASCNAVIKPGSTSSKYICSDSLRSKRLVKFQHSKTVCSIERYGPGNSSIVGGTSGSYVLDDEEGGVCVPGDDRSIRKVLIPSFPDEANGGKVASIISSFWEWKPNLHVHYETAGSENVGSLPVLFLPGFGVGSFHYERQLRELGNDYRVWALDFLGQGKSLPLQNPTLPLKDPTSLPTSGNRYTFNEESSAWGFGDETETWAKDLVYSVDLWKDQVRFFIEEVIKEPVYLVGNSLGGFVSLYFAACYPHLVKGVALLNATPFWGLLPNPVRSPGLSRLFPWAGTFPLPPNVRKLIKVLWQKISDPRSIAEILRQVYADHSTNVDGVFSSIITTTQHPAAAASLASILFAPQAQLSFREALSRCKAANIPICLMYGKEDPWVWPIWGLQVKQQVLDAPYYLISPAGHCPHHEVPEVVNFLLRGWITNVESRGRLVLPLLDDTESADFNVTKDLEFTREGSKKSVRVKYHGAQLSFRRGRFKFLFKKRVN